MHAVVLSYALLWFGTGPWPCGNCMIPQTVNEATVNKGEITWTHLKRQFIPNQHKHNKIFGISVVCRLQHGDFSMAEERRE